MKPTGQPDTKASSTSLRLEYDERALLTATGTADHALAIRLITDVQQALWNPGYLSENERVQDLTAAVAALEAINPRDGLEGMLAVQMVATHNAALECFRRTMQIDVSFEVRESNLKYAEKLLSLYLRELEALQKRRGQGQQNVTVKHVKVEAGGQAMLGVVNASRTLEQIARPNKLAIAPHQPGRPENSKAETR